MLAVIIMIITRLAFIEDYTIKSMRLKSEKWNKLIISDDQRGFLHSFVDQGDKFPTLLHQNHLLTINYQVSTLDYQLPMIYYQL